MHLDFSYAPFLLAFYILITWAICAAALIGIGSLFLRPLVGDHGLLDAFWAGLFFAVLLLQLGHFFVSIGWPFPVFLGGLGIVGLILNGKPVLRSGLLSTAGNESNLPNRLPTSSLLWSLLLSAAIVLRCVGPCDHYDTGFYGAMAVRWFNTYPLVPGLANLMAQLSYNSSVFLCVAALNHRPWNGLAFHLFPGLLLTALVFAVVPAFCRVWRGQGRAPADLFLTLLVIPVLFWVTNSEIIGTNTDLSTTFVALPAISYLLCLYSNGPTNATAAEDSKAVPLLLAALLFSLTASFKLSGTLFGFFGWLLAFAGLWRAGWSPRRRRVLALAAVFLPALLIVTWSLRNVVLSGYPFFPSHFLGVPVDWRVPPEHADYLVRNVRSWARIPWVSPSETEGWRWLGRWFHVVSHNRVDFIFPALFSFAGIIALLWRAELRAACCLWTLVPAVCGLAFWFLSAPGIRFGEFSIWSTAGILGAAALTAVLPALTKNTRRYLLLGLVAIGMWCSFPRTLWRVFYRPAFQQRALPTLAEVPVAPYKVDTNLTVLVPYKLDQCWDNPLPCSPEFFDSLRLRRDSDLRYGFSDAQNAGKSDKSAQFHKLYWKGPEPDHEHW